MKQILFIISLYWCLPCFSMEEQPRISSSTNQEHLCLDRPSVYDESKRTRTRRMMVTKSQLLHGNKVTPQRVKTACKKVLPLWIVPLPLSIASIPVGLHILKDEYLKYTAWTYAPWVMNGVSILWAGIWLASQYKSLRDDHTRFMRLYEQAPDEDEIDIESKYRTDLNLDDGSAEQTEVECLLNTES